MTTADADVSAPRHPWDSPNPGLRRLVVDFNSPAATTATLHVTARTNTGTVLNYGHIAIRCMVHSAVVFRNLKVYTDKLPFTVVDVRP